jgi:TetR/AcrR family transcriptional regulator, fatty acid metabolism regulator protein
VAGVGDRNGDKRARIIDAAVAVFAEKGFHAARVSDVAKRAGVADGTIYLYFKNKEDLLLSLFEDKMAGLIADLDAAWTGIDDPLARMRAYAQHHFRQLAAHPELAQVLQVELRQSHKFFRDYRPEKLWEYLGAFRAQVEEAQRRGLVRAEVDPFLSMWAIFGALDEISIQWVLARKREKFNLEAAADQVVDLFLHGMMASEPKRRRART